MPSLYPSECATHGSTETATHNSKTLETDVTTKTSIPEHKRLDDQSLYSAGRQQPPFPPTDHKDYCASRTAAYVKDQVDSQVPSRHKSIQESIHGHTSRIIAVLDDIDKIIKK